MLVGDIWPTAVPHLVACPGIAGVVTVSNVAPAWPPAGFELNISVTDGVYQSYTQLRLGVVASNEHSPRFSQAVYEAVVAENLAPGAPVAHLSATDPDQGSKLTYAIRSRDCAVHFRINSTTGTSHWFSLGSIAQAVGIAEELAAAFHTM